MALTEREKHEIAETAERLRRAILTLHVDRIKNDMPSSGSGWPEIVREIEKMDHAQPLAAKLFEPSALDFDLMLPTLDWLTWLKNRPVNGDRWFRIVWARAYETPWWKLAARAGKSEKTMRRRHEEAIIKVWGQFGRYDRYLVDKVSKMSDTFV
jgi:hypothetical protein